MKVKSNTKGFQPIKVTIVIESKEELESFWHRTNIGGSQIVEEYFYDFGGEDSIRVAPLNELWRILDNHLHGHDDPS